MADKRAVRRQLYQIQRIKTWQLVVVFVLLLLLTATFLRLNNIGMLERRDAVIAADKQGDTYVIQNRVYDLQNYVSNHMNTSTGQFDLVNEYARDTEAIAAQAAENAGSDGETPFTIADNICKQRFYGYSQAYVQCVAAEQAALPNTAESAQTVDFPDPVLYRFEFIAPGWSPDFAGWSSLVTAIVGLLIIIRLVTELVLRLLLRHQYRHA